MTEIYYMGIDQSYTSTGIVLLDNSGNVALSQTISSSKSDDIYERAWHVATAIGGIIDKHKPKHIGLEGLAFAQVGNATRDLAGLQFVIIAYLRYVYKIANKLTIVAPNELKKFATTKGNAKKQDMVDSLPQDVSESFQKTFKKTKGLYDITDAYWIAKYILELDAKKTQ